MLMRFEHHKGDHCDCAVADHGFKSYISVFLVYDLKFLDIFHNDGLLQS